MADKSADEARFDALLPFFVNQTLDANDQAWMEDHLSTHAQARQQLQFEKVLRDTVLQTQPQQAESERLNQLLKALEADRQSRNPKGGLIAWWDSLALGEWMKSPIRIPSAAFAMVAVLFVAQSVVLVTEMTQSTQEQSYRSNRHDCGPTAPRLRVVFAPDAKHVEIVQLMRKLELTVRDGPSENGELWLSAVPGRSMDETLAMLRTSPLVEQAMVGLEFQSDPACAK